jgi:hypothetical protein
MTYAVGMPPGSTSVLAAVLLASAPFPVTFCFRDPLRSVVESLPLRLQVAIGAAALSYGSRPYSQLNHRAVCPPRSYYDWQRCAAPQHSRAPLDHVRFMDQPQLHHVIWLGRLAAYPLGSCYDWQHHATLSRSHAPPDLVRLWRAIANPCARGHGRQASCQCAETRNSYVVVAGRADAIRAVGAAEAVRALEAIFLRLAEPFVASCP